MSELFCLAPYANQKTNFSNSKLNEKLGLTEDNQAAADNVYSMFAADGNQLVNLVYSEQVYPAKNNIYRKRTNQRTSFKNDFWRDNRFDRIAITTGSSFNNRAFGQSVTTFTASLWPLDGRIYDSMAPDFGPSPGVKTAAHDTHAVSAVNSGSAVGILQSVSVIFHHGRDTPANSATRQNRMITASCLYARPHGLTTGSSVRLQTMTVGTAKGDVDASIQNQNVVQFSGDAPWDAGTQSGKTPFYDSYGHYISTMKLIGKDYSILPEYRISERMNAFFTEKDFDIFNDSEFLNLTGALANVTSSVQDDFYKIYSHSDFTKYFGVVKNDVATKTSLQEDPTQITVRCKALLKLLPYNGFYPASRTVQISELFSASYGDNLTLTKIVAGATDPTFVAQDGRAAGTRPFYAPMIAPGILYNTIKSGIAVDYPVITSSINVAPNGTQAIVSGSVRVVAVSGSDLTANGGAQINDPYAASLQNGEDFYIANEFFDQRIPFEALVEPEEHIANISFLDMEPHPSASLHITASWNGQGDDRFKSAMSNFLAEVPEFFLKDTNFTSFISSPEENFKKAQKDRKYTMKVALRRSLRRPQNQFDAEVDKYPYDANGSSNFIMYSRPSAFGPPVLGALSGVINGMGDAAPHSSIGASAFSNSGSAFGGSNHGHNGPFTPPYYDGGAYCIFEFNPTENKKYTLDEIQSQITASYHRFPNWNLTGTLSASGPMGGTGIGPWAPNRAEVNSMQISASVNLFGRVSAKDLFKFQNVDLTSGDRWAIQTKFETPILNFVDASSSAGLTTIVNTGGGGHAVPLSGGLNTRPYGMWHQYGRKPVGDEGVFFEISKPKFRPTSLIGGGATYINPVTRAPKSDLSLASLLGFSPTSQKLGKVAETKTIREGVVAVPFIEEDNERKFFEISGASLIAQSSTEGETIFTTSVDSIQQMMDSMERYVIPPSFDFLTYPDSVTPITMYIFEFVHQLNEQDLIDIWQNLPPRIARAFDANDGLETGEIMQTKEITHSIGDRELLADVEDKLQWMVFKVKQRGKTSYFEKVIDSNTTTDVPEDLRGEGLGKSLSKRGVKETDFLAGGAAKGAKTLDAEDKISYNWPYDFFSLVELAKIDEDVVFGTPVAVTVDKDFDASTLTPDNVTMPTKKVAKTVVEQIDDQVSGGFTTEGVQQAFTTETTKTVASQIDPSNKSQFVRTGVVTKTESESTIPAATSLPSSTTTPVKNTSTKITTNSTITTTQEESVTEMQPEDSTVATSVNEALSSGKNTGGFKR